MPILDDGDLRTQHLIQSIYLKPSTDQRGLVKIDNYPFGIKGEFAEEVYVGKHPDADYSVLYILYKGVWYDCHPKVGGVYPVRFDTPYRFINEKWVLYSPSYRLSERGDK